MTNDLTDTGAAAAPRTRPRRPALLAAAFVALALLLLGACGDDDGGSDDTTTTAEQTTTTAGDDEEEADDKDDEEADVFDPSEASSSDGGSMEIGNEPITGCLGADESVDIEITVPAGVTTTITVLPTDGGDLVAAAAQETVDDGLSGDPEILEGEGPIEETITIYEYYGDPACYEVSLEDS